MVLSVRLGPRIKHEQRCQPKTETRLIESKLSNSAENTQKSVHDCTSGTLTWSISFQSSHQRAFFPFWGFFFWGSFQTLQPHTAAQQARLWLRLLLIQGTRLLPNKARKSAALATDARVRTLQDGIKPMWEDDRNKLGGRWLMTLNKVQRHNDLDRYWMETVREAHRAPFGISRHYGTVLILCIKLRNWRVALMYVPCVFMTARAFPQLLCLVGESFDEASDDVCGAVVNVRHKADKIAIWTSNCQNREAIMKIGWAPCFWFLDQRLLEVTKTRKLTKTYEKHFCK